MRSAAVPLTGRGAAFFLLSAVLFALGLARAELASLLWGAGVVAPVVYAWLAVGIRGALLRREVAGGAGPRFTISLVPSTSEMGREIELRVRPRMELGRPPGVRMRVAARLRWSGGRTIAIRAPVPRGEEPTAGTAQVQERGVYRGVPELRIEDFFGFGSVAVPYGEELVLHVLPLPRKAEITLEPAVGTAPEASGARRKTRSDELFETKPYVPGDDPRRIAWKLFAHSGALLVRIGEPTPPPRDRLTCLLIPPPALSACDRVVEVFLGLWRDLTDGGNHVQALVLGGGGTFGDDAPDDSPASILRGPAGETGGRGGNSFSGARGRGGSGSRRAESEIAFRRRLAAVEPRGSGRELGSKNEPLPAEIRGEVVLCVGSATDPGLEEAQRRVRGAGARVVAVPVSLAAGAGAATLRTRLRRAVFATGTTAPGTRTATRERGDRS